MEEIAHNMGKRHDVGTAAFYRPWKPKGAAQWVERIFKADWTDTQNPRRTGGHEEDPKKVVAEVTNYWKSLFTRKATDPDAHQRCLDTLKTGNRVQPPTAEKCDADITTPEIIQVCDTLPLGKSAGPDRIPNRFYKTFSKILAPILTNVLNESREAGELPHDLSAGIISTLYKKKERDDPRNYRPITLLNGDYKIFTRVLTRRMNEAVVQFVSAPQNGFVPDSFLPENIMLLKLIQAYVGEEDLDAYLVFLDMEKAFDRCSWDFLIDAMSDIGFGDGFVKYVKLMYSHDHPPQRQLHVNGYLGPKFPLGSGVAQGCPLSPLLFLLITEPLSRLIERDDRIAGVTVDGIRYVISQYADDTTLINTPGDETATQENVEMWMGGTAMQENATKREGMLMGALNTQRDRAPTGVIANDAWLQDGDHIRALGAPMGNDLDEEKWWLGRYRVVKDRVARWPSLRRLSIDGRNMLLQSIFYGSFRFWLYFMVLPRSIIRLIEQDAKQILWATTPELDAQDDGSKKCRRWIRELASYLPRKGGGAGIMHFESHCEAFYATWLIRYLHPRKAPWKALLRHWIDEEHVHEGILLSSARDRSRVNELPRHAHYARRCLRAFDALNIKQNTDLLDHAVQAEPLWHNHRFHIPMTRDRVQAWQKYLETTHISSLLDTTSSPFTPQNWDWFFLNMAPPNVAGRPRYYEWEAACQQEIQTIQTHVPLNVMNAVAPPTPSPNEITAITDPLTRTTRYAELDEDGVTYHELWLDLSQRPHRTGGVASPRPNEICAPAERWDDTPTDPGPWDTDEDDDNEDDEANPRPPPLPPAVMGPSTTTYPRNLGWHLPNQKPCNEKGEPRKLSDITIHAVTKHLTSYVIGRARPHCIVAWQERMGHALPFDKIFRSFGTPLSGAS